VKRRARAVFEDWHRVKVTIADTEESLTRLLAEVIARVPWALSRFDEGGEAPGW
jgi:hypothetical protein